MSDRRGKSMTLSIPSTERVLHNTIIYDSPGINNSRDDGHREIAIKTFEKEKFAEIILVLNAENMCTTDDLSLIEELKKNGVGTQKEVLIVVNKIDKILMTIQVQPK